MRPANPRARPDPGPSREVRPGIVGIAGPSLQDEERALFARLPPAAVILFARNCVDRSQLALLVGEIAGLHPGRPTPVLIDQEGGRVMRLRPPVWRSLPAAGRIGRLAEADAARAAWLLGRLIAHDLAALGIGVACAPVTDLAWPGGTPAIGDRAFGAEPGLVTRLAHACLRGLRDGGIAPVIKHLPGHGRAVVDSHVALPVVAAGLDELTVTDLSPPRALAGLADLAMTAHVVYRAIDAERPATLSPTVIGDVIRSHLGFRGILLSDDLAMGALSGEPATRATAALAAGCDLALHCSGRLGETRNLLEAVPEVDPHLLARFDAVTAVRPAAAFDAPAGQRELDLLIAAAA